MEIEELKKERANAEMEIQTAIQAVLERFVQKTGLPIENVIIGMEYDKSTVNGHEMYPVKFISCEVKW